MSFLKPDKPKIPAPRPTPAAPTPAAAEIEKARSDLSERRKRARGRAASNVTGGFLRQSAIINRPILADRLG